MRFGLLLTFLLFAISISAQSPAVVEREMLEHLSKISKFGTYGGAYEEDKLYAENRQLKEKLLRYGKQAAILRYAFPKLKDEMKVATSKDGKLRIYSWDLQTGGTMHDYANVFQYQGKSGRVYSWTENREDESAGSFYTEVFQFDTAGGPVYLATSTFIGSSSLNGQSIEIVRINGETLDRNAKLIQTRSGLQNSISFGYDFFSVVDRPDRPVRLFRFNEAKKEFLFPVVIEDEKTPQGRVTNKFITYRFNGKYFVKTD